MTNLNRVLDRAPRLVWFTAAATVVLVLGIVWVANRGDADDATNTAAVAHRTSEVTRQTIADERSFAGTLGHGAGHTVRATAGGVITGITAQGTEIGRGSVLYLIDEAPVVAMMGEVPMYRDLVQGTRGRDVAQLIENLNALGYGGDCDTMDEFTACVRRAVRAWQEDRGVEITGQIELADVVFVPGGGRVDTTHSSVGDSIAPGTPILDLTSADQIVSLDIDIRHRDLLSTGTEVTVQIPGGDTMPGTVTAANVVATSNGAGTEDTIGQVEVTLLEPIDIGYLGSPVDVLIEVDHRVDVLTVPVNALLALAGGGHGVEVVGTDGTTTIVAVETGLFASGWVEVSGSGIDEGTTVVVAGR